ncbi:hypothetical protein G4D82_11980 [Flavobacterium sp. CYK-4]|uniref:capsular polysaccharide export protein, LipB/KpsS family n=1 Tax=Flavobacterium lotistagni TaxID=2709660 RepID=UPI001407E46D|nr:hypothetical protein [Flavobacterium lotistagni]NHM07943.1 hypothetical protein [Flavobacterium lotistagni]
MTHLDTIKNQTILLQTSNHPTPHLETELEIMERLLQQGNTIYWIICKGDFQACFHNPEHRLMHCKVCHSRVENGLKLLQTTVENHRNLYKLQYNDFLSLTDFKQQGYSPQLNFKSKDELKAHQYKTYDNGMATMSSLVSYTRDHEPDLFKYQDFIRRGLLTGAYLYEVFQLVIEKIKPDLVIIFNGRFIENRPLLRVCEHRKITYATHERGGKMKNFLFRFNSIPHSFEAIAEEIQTLWQNAGADREQIGAKFFAKRVKRIEDAWYSFTKNQNYGQLPESFKANQDKKIITIFNSSLDEYEGLSGFGPKFYTNDNDGILQICESLKAYPNIKLYLRVHPNLKGLNNTQNRFIDEKIKASNIEVIAPQDSVDSYELVQKSDIIIVFTSTVGVEAAFAGKKVVLLGRAAYESLQCAVIPKSHDELMRVLTDDAFEFPSVNPENPIKFGYWFENFGIDYQYYQASGISKGKYKGQTIKANFFLRRLKRMAKWFS